MRLFFTNLLNGVRTLLSWFGHIGTTPTTAAEDHCAVHRADQAPSSNSGVAKPRKSDTVNPNSGHPAPESEDRGHAKAKLVQRRRNAVDIEADSNVVGKETTDTEVHEGQSIKIEDNDSKPSACYGEANSGGVESPSLPEDGHNQAGRDTVAADADMECDSFQESPIENFETPAESQLRCKETNHAAGRLDCPGHPDDSECSDPYIEVDEENVTSHSAIDRGISDQGSDAAVPVEHANGDDGTAGVESETVNIVQPDKKQSRTSVPRPTDVKTQTAVDAREQNTTRSSEEESRQGHSRPLSSRRPKPAEDAREYPGLVQDITAVDREYSRWNTAIVEQLLLSNLSSEYAYLCINPRVLARVFEDAGLGLLSPEDAQQHFSAAIANVYKKRVLGHPDGLRVLRRCSSNDPPDCTAFLAGSVLAAYRMQSDEEASGNAYYRRLADLLGCETQGVHPIGFNPTTFESLWTFLHNWLRDVHGRRLALPRSEVGLRRFVALPLAHVPLRSLDVDKLPAFFSWAGFQPGSRVRDDLLLANLRQWQNSRNMFTPTGAGALSDDRCASVLAQVSTELELWDGSFCESSSKRSALVEIQFDVVQRKPLFYYLPRRPTGFPEIFVSGERVFEATDDGWYDPAQIRTEDGELLESGFEWPSQENGVRFTLRRPGAVVIPFVPSSSCSGFLSSRGLLRGVRCSVLCTDRILPTVTEYLNEVAQSSLNPTSHPLIPNGWSMFRSLTAHKHVAAPNGLEALEVDPNIEVIAAGGLRIGRRWMWLAGGAPRIVVSGTETHDRVTLNGTPVEIGDSGELMIGEYLSHPGEYLIQAGNVRRNIEIARPKISVAEQLNRISTLDSHNPKIALPQGSWTLIGDSPYEVRYSHAAFFRGKIASCPFQPIWAIQVGAGPGATVAAISNPSSPRSIDLQSLTGKNGKLVEKWMSIIYQAHIRRPRFIGLNGFVPDASIIDVWRQYTVLAKKIKRELKRPQ